MERTLVDRRGEEELIDTKVGGVHLMDKGQRHIPLLCNMGFSMLIMR